MSTESIVLLSNALDDSLPLTWQYSPKNKVAGYHKKGDGVHTVVFELDNFKGSIKIQATLELYPADSDWFDVIYDSSDVNLTALDSTPITNKLSSINIV